MKTIPKTVMKKIENLWKMDINLSNNVDNLIRFKDELSEMNKSGLRKTTAQKIGVLKRSNQVNIGRVSTIMDDIEKQMMSLAKPHGIKRMADLVDLLET